MNTVEMERGVNALDIKITLAGFEKEMRLIDKANSLIGELKRTVSELHGYTDVCSKIVREGDDEDDGTGAT